MIGVKSHHNVGPDGQVKYPLPHEGQPENIPKLLGGKQSNDPDEKPGKRRPEGTNYWNEGWYMWTGSGRWAMLEKTETMLLDLEQQQRLEALKDRKREAMTETSMTKKLADGPEGAHRKNWGYVVPRNSDPDARYAIRLISTLNGRLTKIIVRSPCYCLSRQIFRLSGKESISY